MSMDECGLSTGWASRLNLLLSRLFESCMYIYIYIYNTLSIVYIYIYIVYILYTICIDRALARRPARGGDFGQLAQLLLHDDLNNFLEGVIIFG
jgi:hypothetical protein